MVEITQENFEQFFFDIRKNKPKKGQVMACYRAVAEFVDGRMKKDVIHLLQKMNNGGESAAKLMRKLACATEGDSYRVPRELAEDLLSGMTVEEVENKSYKFVIEVFYYTQREFVPEDDPHWSLIEILNQNQLDENGICIKSKIVENPTI